MLGILKRLSINGTTFKAPKDCEIEVTPGGYQYVDSDTYGDGTSAPKQDYVQGKITGVQVSTADTYYTSLASFLNTENLTIVAECADKTYELTGYLVAPDGLKLAATKDRTAEFELHSQQDAIKVG